MKQLMFLEIKRNSLKPYITSFLITTAIAIGFLYLFALIPKLDPTETDLEMFMTYNSVTTLTNILLIVAYTIMSSVMYTKFIIEEYIGKRSILLFSYPINRKKVFCSKIMVVIVFTFLSMFFTDLITYGLFYLTESFMPLSSDTLTFSTIIRTFFSTIVYSILACSLSCIALWIGFFKKSSQVLIVSAVIIVCCICQLLAVCMQYFVITISLTLISSIISYVFIMSLSKKITTMEV